jgi:hypothetical protein
MNKLTHLVNFPDIYLIRSTSEIDDETSASLFWSVHIGWVSIQDATIFLKSEIATFAYFPLGSEIICYKYEVE